MSRQDARPPVRRPALRKRAADARSSARPAAARRPAAAGAAKRLRAPGQGGLSGRALAFLLVLAALSLSYAIPVRIYLTQLAEIDTMTQAQEDQRRHIESLEEQAAKWNDEEYVRIQVRKRLYWVQRGEIPLIPIWGDTVEGGKPPAKPAPTTWYETLMSSVDTANG